MGNFRVYVDEKFVKRLNKQVQSHKSPNLTGFLLGYESDEVVQILGCYACKDVTAEALESGWNDVCYYLPAGITPVGIFCKTSQTCDIDFVAKVLEKIIPSKLMQNYFGDSLLVWPVESDDTPQLQSLYEYDLWENSTSKHEFDSVSCDSVSHSPLQKFLTVRLHAQLPFGFELSPNKDVLEDNMAFEFDLLRNKLNDDRTLFKVRQTNVLLADLPEPTAIGTSLETPLKELISMVDSKDNPDKLKRRKAGDFSQDIIHLDLLVNLSAGSPAGSEISCAPIIHHEHKDYQYLSLKLPVDILLLVRPSDSLESLLVNIRESISRQLDGMHRSLVHYRQGQEVHIPRPYHFCPRDIDHPITVVYPDDISDEQLELYRRELHSRFLLPDDCPFLRKLNAYHFPDEEVAGGYLTNTHFGLSPSGVKGGSFYQVSGTYSYHHYMQDHMDDNGWGCAYRSLQTLVSWFRHQGYSDKPVPTHKEIQQMLVDMGDKEAKFVGSKQWIGSTEVGYVLEHYIGVTSKILFVSSGAELGSKGRELAMHFESQGTPVMIGGGVLAHTILGVDFNDVTGDLKFLILDPHYTGAEDLKTIQDKGWCGWKGPDFWDQNAYYNMCMPQRPAAI